MTNKKSQTLAFILFLHVLILLIAGVLLVKQKGKPVQAKEKIMVIPIDGVITFSDRGLGRGQSVESIVQTLHDLEDQPDVKGVVLRINSPGGSIGAVQEIFRALMKLKQKGKVITSSFADVAASGGYYLACAGDSIVTNPGTLTGSIGVIMQMPNVKGLLEKVGVSFETIKSGDFKDSGSPYRKMTDAERAYFHEVILDAYSQFFNVVKEGRKLDENTLKPLADGRIFSGQMAVKLKLADQLGGLDEAIEEVKKRTGLAGKKPTIIYPQEKNSLDRFVRMLSKTPVSTMLDSVATPETKIEYMMQ